jgi:4-oxalocrotonate tautomerase
MPLARISIRKGKLTAHKRAIADGVYEALRETVRIPEGDRFQILTEHGDEDLIVDSHYLGIERSRDNVIIQIFLTRGRTVEKKQALYRSIVERLHASAGVRKEDVMIVLTEAGTEDWSFGLGEAQYVLNPPKVVVK